MQLNVLTTGMTATSNMDGDWQSDHQEPLAIHESRQRHSYHHHHGEMLHHHHADYPHVHHAAHDDDHHSRHTMVHQLNHQLRGNHQAGEHTSIHPMYRGHSSHHHGKSAQDEEHPKLHKLWSMMNTVTTSLDFHTIHTMERHIGPAMHSLHRGCNEDWKNFCSEEIQADAHRVHSLKLSFPHTHVDMARVVCLAKKYDQVSSHCKTNIALLDLTKTNHHGKHGHHAHHHKSHHHHGKKPRHHHAGHTHHESHGMFSHIAQSMSKKGENRPVIQHADIVSRTMLASDSDFSVNPDTYSAILLGVLFLWGCFRIARYCCQKRKQTNHTGFGNYEPVGNYYVDSDAPPAYQPCLV